MIINALAAECGANVFEIGHRNTDGKYEKKKAAMMMHMVFKVAKAFAPSIIKFDEAELTWISDKKKVKAMGFGSSLLLLAGFSVATTLILTLLPGASHEQPTPA